MEGFKITHIRGEIRRIEDTRQPQAKQLRAITVSGNIAEHFNGVVGIAVQQISFTNTSNAMLIRNTHDTQDLFISFDGGNNFFGLGAGEDLSLDIELDSIHLYGSGVDTSYEIIIVG